MICTETGRVIYDEKLHPFNLRGRIRIATGVSKPQLPNVISRKIGDLCAEYLVDYGGTFEEDYDFVLGIMENIKMGTLERDISVLIEDLLIFMVTEAALTEEAEATWWPW